eukprot:TRINITY_DN4160_c0_g1_i1.p1 TRINITY_DN4160_c0_g1~~TRINITY_DN4160_c0_g1_i1.p1  ORF type:complete len:1445 (-),score=207.08 TRINITY_DN4160_c0_g1_i1:28-3957(-)
MDGLANREARHRKDNQQETRTLSASTIKELKEVLVHYPLVGKSLSTHLKEQHQLSYAINNCYVDIIDELLSSQQLSEACFFFQCLGCPSSLVAYSSREYDLKFRTRVDKLFERFLALVHKDEDVNDRIEINWLQKACSSLLCLPTNMDGALFQFLAMEDNYIRQKCLNDNILEGLKGIRLRNSKIVDEIPWPFRVLKSERLQSTNLRVQQFWHRYFNFIRVSDVHLLEYVLDKCIGFIKQEKWDECKVLLEPFPLLKPLLLLMTWNLFFDRYDAQVALSNLLMIEDDFPLDPELKQKCLQLTHLIQLTNWAVEKMPLRSPIKIGVDEWSEERLKKEQVDLGERKKVESFLSTTIHNALQSHSLVYVMQSYFKDIPVDKFRSVLESGRSISTESATSVEQDLILLNSFHSIMQVIDALDDVAEGKHSKVSFSNSFLASITQNAPVALFVFKFIFSLMFLTTGENKSGSSSRKDKFVCSQELAENIIELISSSLPDVVKSWDEMKLSYTQEKGDNVADQFQKDLDAFQSIMKEAFWRLQLLKKIGTGASPFLNVFLASPTTLLVLCIRCKDWPSCRAVIQFFQLEEESVDLTNKAEEYSNLCSSIISTENYNKEYFPAPVLVNEKIDAKGKLLMSLNLISVFGLSNSAFNEYIRDNFQRGDQESEKTSLYTDNLIYHFERLSVYHKYPEFLAHSHLSPKYLVEFPVQIERLSDYLQSRVGLKSIKDTLHQAVMPLASLHQYEASDVLLERLLQTAPGETSRGYLLSFIKYLLDFGKLVGNDASVGQANYFNYLEAKPRDIISKLVFISKNYSQAEKLAAHFNIDLTLTILEAMDGNPGRLASASASASASALTSASEDIPDPESTPSGISRTRSFRSRPSEGIRNSSSSENSESPMIQRNTVVLGGGRGGESFAVKMPEIEYISSKSKMIGVLASILLSPNYKFDNSFINYAIKESAPYPAVQRWVLSRCRAYGVFQDVFINQRFEDLASNLDPEIDIEHLTYATRKKDRKSKKGRSSYASSVARSNNGISIPLSTNGTAVPSAESVDIYYQNSFLNSRTSGVTIAGSVESSSLLPKSLLESSCNREYSIPSVAFPSQSTLPQESIPFYCFIMQEDSIKGDDIFYRKVIDKVVVDGAVSSAISLADIAFSSGPSDFLKAGCAETTDEKSLSWKFIMRISNRVQQAQLILKHYPNWDIDKAIDLLFMSHCHLQKLLTPEENENSFFVADTITELPETAKANTRQLDEVRQLSEQISKIRDRLDCFKKILRATNNSWASWRQIEEQALQDPSALVHQVLNLAHYELARKVIPN